MNESPTQLPTAELELSGASTQQYIAEIIMGLLGQTPGLPAGKYMGKYQEQARNMGGGVGGFQKALCYYLPNGREVLRVYIDYGIMFDDLKDRCCNVVVFSPDEHERKVDLRIPLDVKEFNLVEKLVGDMEYTQTAFIRENVYELIKDVQRMDDGSVKGILLWLLLSLYNLLPHPRTFGVQPGSEANEASEAVQAMAGSIRYDEMEGDISDAAKVMEGMPENPYKSRIELLLEGIQRSKPEGVIMTDSQ